MRDQRYVRMFRALANETRFAIFKMIVQNKGIYCSEIVKALPVSQSAISLHLKELRNANLIRQKRKNNILYCLPNRYVLRQFTKDLQKYSEK